MTIRAFPTRGAALMAALAIAGGGPAAAQELRIRVSEPGRPTMAVGVLVSLLDPGGATVTRGVTNDFGRVRLTAPAGRYQARIERPGFADTAVAVTIGTTIDSVTVTHSRQRLAWPARLVPLPTPCRTGGIPDPVRPLWLAADRLLRVVAASEERQVATFGVAAFERRLSTALKRDAEEVSTILASANRPANAASAAALAQAGYLRRDSGLVWLAPDITVFDDEAFLVSHCFGTTSGTGTREGLLGLSFAPVGTDRVDIEGTYWIDPTSGELKVIDYRFTGVPADWRPERFGGSLEFHRAEQGFWVTRFWYQRTPMVASSGGRERLQAYREVGAEITHVTAAVDTTDRVALARAIAAQNEAIRNRAAALAGQVVDTLGYPVPDAEISVMGTEFTGTSDRNGRFSITGIPLGLQIVRVRKVGYKFQYFGLRLAGGQQWEGKITVAKLPQTLGEIVVVGKYGKPAQYANTAKYDDFYRRRASKAGRFLTREDIDKSAAGRISELLRTVPGVRVGFVAPGQSEDVSFLTCPASNVGVWIDGQKVTGQVGEILPLIAPSDIETMEIYQRQALIPPEFRDNSCGAIVIWTR